MEIKWSSMRPNLKIPIARMGKWHHPNYGQVSFNQEDFDAIIQNFEKNARGYEPYLRYGHHEKGPGIHDGEKALGHMVNAYQEGDILWGVFSPNNDQVVEEIRSGQYRYASAELIRNAMDKRTGELIRIFLKGHTLTNAPFVPDLPQNKIDYDDQVSFLSDGGTTTYYLSDIPAVVLSAKDSLVKDQELTTVARFFRNLLGMSEVPGAQNLSEGKKEMDAKKMKAMELKQKLADMQEELSELLADDENLAESHGAPLAQAAKALEKMSRSEDEEDSREKKEMYAEKDMKKDMMEEKLSDDEMLSDEELADAIEKAMMEKKAKMKKQSLADRAKVMMADKMSAVKSMTPEEAASKKPAQFGSKPDEQLSEQDVKDAYQKELLPKGVAGTVQAKAMEDNSAEAKAAKAAGVVKYSETAEAEIAALKQQLSEAQKALTAREESAESEKFEQLLSDRVNKAVAAGVMPATAEKAANLVKALHSEANGKAFMLSEGSEPLDLISSVFELLSEGKVDFSQHGADVAPSGEQLSDNPYADRIGALRNKKK